MRSNLTQRVFEIEKLMVTYTRHVQYVPDTWHQIGLCTVTQRVGIVHRHVWCALDIVHQIRHANVVD